jgi:integrase/recombinase XerD
MNNIELRKFEQAYAQFERLLKLRGYSEATQDSYLRSLRRFAHWASKCPHKRMSKDLFENYFSELLESHSWSTIKCDRNGLMRYWELVLECEWPWPDLVKPPVLKKLPDILTQADITAILNEVREPRFRVFIYTTYSLGLRSIHKNNDELVQCLMSKMPIPAIQTIVASEKNQEMTACNSKK